MLNISGTSLEWLTRITYVAFRKIAWRQERMSNYWRVLAQATAAPATHPGAWDNGEKQSPVLQAEQSMVPWSHRGVHSPFFDALMLTVLMCVSIVTALWALVLASLYHPNQYVYPFSCCLLPLGGHLDCYQFFGYYKLNCCKH